MNHIVTLSPTGWGRVDPHNHKAEQALLGALLANNKCYDSFSGYLRAEHFCDPVHDRIYRAASSLIEQGRLADAVTLKHQFSEAGTLADVGGTAYLTDLLAAMVGINNASDYARIVYDTWLRRELASISENTLRSVYDPETGLSGPEILDSAAGALSELAISGSGQGRSVSGLEAVDAAIQEGEGSARGDVVAAVSTGIPSLDKIILRLRPGNLVVIGGRPGIGKTGVARSIALNVALGLGTSEHGEIIDDPKAGHGVCYCSLEETEEEFGAAAIAQLANVSINDVLTGAWAVKDALPDHHPIVKARRKMASDVVVARNRIAKSMGKLELFCQSRQSARMIRQQARATMRKMKGDLKLLVVDYLQLMPDNPGSKEKRLAVGMNAYALKDLAKELGICVILLSQLSRRVDERTDHRPTMSDLRETGEIEDAADVVLFPYREAYYFAKTKPQRDGGQPEFAYEQQISEWQAKLTLIESKAEMIAEKVRRGRAPAFCELAFTGHSVRFGEPQ